MESYYACNNVRLSICRFQLSKPRDAWCISSYSMCNIMSGIEMWMSFNLNDLFMYAFDLEITMLWLQ